MLTYLSFLIVAFQLYYYGVSAVRRIILTALSYCIAHVWCMYRLTSSCRFDSACYPPSNLAI